MGTREIPTNIDFEIINIQKIDSYISECEIKVFYHGKNRNGSYISKAVGTQIANSLPRSPIVAFYNEEVGDYEDHGHELIINKQGLKFVTKTVPYGVVSETAPIVWKQFMAPDGTIREYVVCKGYLWSGRYPHLQKVVENSKAQSMELFSESVIGDWAKFDNDDEEFFIINEASISALCILGDDVEPCFEGASIGKPEVLYSLKKDEFKQEFNLFMQELNEVLTHNLNEGGSEEVKIIESNMIDPVEEIVVDNVIEDNFASEEEVEAVIESQEIDPATKEAEEVIIDNNLQSESEGAEEFVETPVEEPTQESEFEVVEEVAENNADSDFQNLQNKYEALEEEFNQLKDKYEILLNSNKAKENEEKETLCNKFAILGEEVIEEFKDNLDLYTFEQLEEKLSAIAFKKGVSFTLMAEDGIITPTPQHKNDASVPAWVKAVEERVNNK